MPRLAFSFPMLTEADSTRFRHLFACLQYDPAVISYEAAPRDNPFIQRVEVVLHEHMRLTPPLGLQLAVYLETSRRNLLEGSQIGLVPVEEPLPSPPSAVADTSWVDLVPKWVRPGAWIRSGNVRYMVLRVDVPAHCVVLQAEDKTEPESIHLDALRFFGTGSLPSQPNEAPTYWDRLLGSDDDAG